MQGSSALQGVLERVKEPVDVFAVWEPVLPTDVLPPGTETLARLGDRRVWQLWDRGHFVSDEMRAGMMAHPSAIPIETRRRRGKVDGVLWDAVAIFPAGATWGDTLPAPSYLGGDVVDVTQAVREQLARMTQGDLPRGR